MPVNNGYVFLWAEGNDASVLTLRSLDYGKQQFTLGSIKEASVCPATGQELQPDWMAWFPPADAPNAALPIGHYGVHQLLKFFGGSTGLP